MSRSALAMFTSMTQVPSLPHALSVPERVRVAGAASDLSEAMVLNVIALPKPVNACEVLWTASRKTLGTLHISVH
jgi:hypothetical protein